MQRPYQFATKKYINLIFAKKLLKSNKGLSTVHKTRTHKIAKI